MATFYVLPPRRLLGRRFADFLATVFPGQSWPENACRELAEALEARVTCRPDVYVVFREDLPEGQAMPDALREQFGAEAGDQVVELPGTCRTGLHAPAAFPSISASVSLKPV